MGNYSMPRYFQNMPVVGKPVKANAENATELRAIEDDIHAHVVKALEAGKPDEAKPFVVTFFSEYEKFTLPDGRKFPLFYDGGGNMGMGGGEGMMMGAPGPGMNAPGRRMP